MRRSAQWRHVDAIVAVSQAVAASMQAKHANLASRITIIPNGVHLAGGSRPRGEVRAELGLAGPPSPASAPMSGDGTARREFRATHRGNCRRPAGSLERTRVPAASARDSA